MRAFIVLAALVVACGETSASPSPSSAPTPVRFGTATLSATDCNFEMPTTLPLRTVRFHVVNRTRYTGHFGLSSIDANHTFQELVDFWNGPLGKIQHASFAHPVSEQAVSADRSLDLLATVDAKGTYAFHCGYADENDKVTGFWHELRAD